MTTSTTSSARPTPADDFRALRLNFSGEVITPSDSIYDQARLVANLNFSRMPAAIVRPKNADDVAAAVRFANRTGRVFCVKSGGHSVAGHGVIDDAIVIDMSTMKAVNIDAGNRIAQVQPGATSGDLMGPAHAYGLALSTGDTSSVGLGGLTLGGGIGFMARKYGLAIDNLVKVELVTADGVIVTADASRNADLFWALRGGGGNFGIVTEFTFQLAPVGSVYGGALVLPATKENMRAYFEYAKSAPDELTTIVNVMHAPPAPFIPEEKLGELIMMILVCYTGDAEEGERVVAPLRAIAEPIADAVGQIPYPVMYAFTEAAAQPHCAEVRSMFGHGLTDETIDATLEAMNRATSPMSMVQFRGLGGAISRVGADETAYAHRSQDLFVAVLGLWLDPAEDAAPHREWVAGLWEAIRGAGCGVYANFVADEGHGRTRDAYPESTYNRLAEVKRSYDPRNVFQFNQNIRPA